MSDNFGVTVVANRLKNEKPEVGLDPATCALRMRCSTIELSRHYKLILSEMYVSVKDWLLFIINLPDRDS